MRKYWLLWAFALLCGCQGEESECQEKEFELQYGDNFSIEGGCAKVEFRNKIGIDFQSALASMQREYNQLFQKPYSIQTRNLAVDFPYDARQFVSLIVMENGIISLEYDAIDSYGNHYIMVSCPD